MPTFREHLAHQKLVNPSGAIRRAALSWLIDAANPREIYRGPIEPRTARSINEEVSMGDLIQLRSDSRKMYANVGVCKGAIDDKAIHVVGRSWLPKYDGLDAAWGKEAKQWLIDEWYPVADIHGRDFQTALYLASVGIDRDGDCGMMLTEYDTGFPALQIIPAHQIGQRDNKTDLADGEYSGLQMMHGVVINDIGRAVAYKVLGAKPDGSEDRFISARDFMLLYEPEWADQLRGFPGFTHAILDLKTLRTVQGYEKMACELASSIGIIETNETGLPDYSDPRVGLNGGLAVNAGMTTEERAGGLIKYFKAGAGGKLEAFKSDRPGAAWEQFMDRLIRNAMTGIGWPYELAWDISKLGGANTRLILARALYSVDDRQNLLLPFARRAVGYAVSKAAKMGKISAPPDDWFKWSFTMPARITSDYGRDAKADRDDYIMGITNLTTILEEDGRQIDQHIAERKAENEMLKAAGLPVPSQAFVDKIVTKDGLLPPDKGGEVPAGDAKQ